MTPGERIAAGWATWLPTAEAREQAAAEIDRAIEADRRAAIRALQRERATYPQGVATQWLSKAIHVLMERKGKAVQR